MKKWFTLIILLMVIQAVSGQTQTKLFLDKSEEQALSKTITLNDIFYNCDFENQGFWECGAYFFIPNLHFEALNFYVFDNIFTIPNILDIDGYFLTIIKGMIMYSLIFVIEFIKNWVIFGAMFTSINGALRSVGSNTINAPDVFHTSLLFVILMIIGSLILVSMDWSNALSGVGG